VLQDYPIGFWPLQNIGTSQTSINNVLYSSPSLNYNETNSFYSTQGNATLVSDISGCGNTATYSGSIDFDILPIIPGGISGTKIYNQGYIEFPITKNYYGATVGDGFGTKYTSDNDFTLELWISQSIESSSEVPILADIQDSIGLFWENGDIVFKVSNTETVRYRVPYSKKSLHIVGVYSVGSITLYIDSFAVDTKSLSNFKFTNEVLNLQSGPTINSEDSFIIDAPAVYRYGLQQELIRKHYVNGNLSTSAINVVYPDGGILFSGTDANIKAVMDYSYPASRPWSDFVDENTYYDPNKRYISFYKTESATPKTFIINDYFFIPSQIGITTSKIEWRNDLGITVESSTDGITYSQCTNGMPLPQYTKDSFDSSGNIYIRITMSTTDASKYLPKLSFFCITFYADRTIYADNFGDTITSSTDYYLGSLNYPVLSRHHMNGIRAKNGAGFDLNTSMSVKSIEMFFTPLTLASNTLLYASAPSVTRLAWNGSGTVSKANIAKIYVNNIDVTNQTNIGSYLNEEHPNHIVIVFTNPVTGVIKLNYESAGGPSNLYNNIAIYPTELNAEKVETHFELYSGKPVETITENAITLTELDTEYYNNDWVVLQSI
jgi:hypothetical protein